MFCNFCGTQCNYGYSSTEWMFAIGEDKLRSIAHSLPETELEMLSFGILPPIFENSAGKQLYKSPVYGSVILSVNLNCLFPLDYFQIDNFQILLLSRSKENPEKSRKWIEYIHELWLNT